MSCEFIKNLSEYLSNYEYLLKKSFKFCLEKLTNSIYETI